MYPGSARPAAIEAASRAAKRALIVALLLGTWCGLSEAADLTPITKTLARQTQRLNNDAGQFYMAWWLPSTLSQILLRETLGQSESLVDTRLRPLQPFLVFAVSRGQVTDRGLVDVHDQKDLLRNSRLTLDGQSLSAAPADQDDADARSTLEQLKPALESMLGNLGHGIEFVLYRPVPGTLPPEPSGIGALEYSLYHKHFRWRLPVWGQAAAAPAAAPTPLPVAPAALPAAPPAPLPVAAPVVAAPVVAAPAVAPSRPSAANPIPVQRRKIDPVSGEEFPERYEYNPYTGQKLVSQ